MITTFKSPISLSILICIVFSQKGSNGNEAYPTIMLKDRATKLPWTDDWKRVDLASNEIHLIAKHRSALALHFNCSSPDPIEIILDSTSLGNDIVFNRSGLVIRNSTYATSLTLKFEKNYKRLLTIKCQKNETMNNFTIINVIIPPEDDYLWCPTTDPEIAPKLFLVDHEGGPPTEIKNGSYDRTRGFKLEVLESGVGTFSCQPGEQNTETTPSSMTYAGFVIQPDEIKTRCRECDVALVVYQSVENFHNITDVIENESKYNLLWVSFDLFETTEVVKIGALEEPDKQPTVDIYCLKTDKRTAGGKNITRRLSEKWTVRVKAKVPPPYLGDQSNSTADSNYFFENSTTKNVSLLEWEDFPYDEYIFMLAEGDSTLHTNTTSTFTCKTGRNESDELVFLMEFTNGTFVQVYNDSSNWKAHIKLENRSHFLLFGWTLSIDLPIEAVAIHCKIPTPVHPSFYLGAERRFVTRHLAVPTIKPKQSTYQFYIGQTNQKIVCFAEGEPRPILYTWERDFEVFDTKNFTDIEITRSRNGDSTLTFLNVTNETAGTYSCNATNRMGEYKFNFTVELIEDPKIDEDRITRRNTIITITTVVIIALGICSFGIYRYYAARRLMRGLNDQEIKEFFEGRPELAKHTEKNKPFSGDFDVLPYNRGQHEIDDKDRTLDYSTILGQGEFAYVIKGHITTRNLDVAVKIAKSTADVTLFKALLSEVKILCYIGSHKNVAGLVGVNTSDIQNRNIYIYMDLCELGSLEKYLRKNKPNFVNLIDENQQINTSNFIPNDSEGSVSTLDLIRWAGEIATGMEYLAYKSIIHADLAARNVLLTKDKTVRVSDFGMSKKLYECNFYVKKTKCPLPWRWMALESLKTLTFSTESDVWSFGVTLWEVFSLGDVPFPNEEWNNAFVDMLVCGIRMGKPKYSTSEVYSKTVGCWDENPSKRPQFSTIRNYFCALYETLARNVPNGKPVEEFIQVETDGLAEAKNFIPSIKHRFVKFSGETENGVQESTF